MLSSLAACRPRTSSAPQAPPEEPWWGGPASPRPAEGDVVWGGVRSEDGEGLGGLLLLRHPLPPTPLGRPQGPRQSPGPSASSSFPQVRTGFGLGRTGLEGCLCHCVVIGAPEAPLGLALAPPSRKDVLTPTAQTPEEDGVQVWLNQAASARASGRCCPHLDSLPSPQWRHWTPADPHFACLASHRGSRKQTNTQSFQS